MEKAKIIVRFSVFSKNDNAALDYEKIKNLLPKSDSSHIKGEKKVLLDGRMHPNDYEDTSYDYELTFQSLDLDYAHKKWINFWSNHFEILKLIKSEYNFNFHLNYEITVYDMNYPSIYFPVKYLSILSETGIELSLYIYND